MYDIRFPDFSDKIVLVYLANRSDDHSIVIEHPTFEIQGGRVFIVGQFAEGTTSNDWASGVQTAVSWDAVEQYLVFDTIEEYFSRISQGWDDRTVQ
jgi:hypothetical protein